MEELDKSLQIARDEVRELENLKNAGSTLIPIDPKEEGWINTDDLTDEQLKEEFSKVGLKMIPSAIQMGDMVKLEFPGCGLVGRCFVTKIAFLANLDVQYDVEVDMGDNGKTRIHGVNSAFVVAVRESEV